MTIDLSKLAEPFPLDDIEWRVSRSGRGPKGLYCLVIPFITARGVQQRLDDVCEPQNWQLIEPRILSVNNKAAFACGLSIRCEEEWITKWDVAEPTNVEAAKGGWSGAEKRAGAQWGIGRYLYYLDEVFAETTESQPAGSRLWNYARLPEKHGGGVYWWKTPGLPGWALPKDKEHEISEAELNELKRSWKEKFGVAIDNPKDLREGFARFVASVVGEFPVSDRSCWTRDAWQKCRTRIQQTTDPAGVSGDVPFEE